MATAARTRPNHALTDEQREARVKELKNTLDAAVLSLENEETWVNMLHTVQQFGTRYSWGNQLLIMVQARQRGFEPRLVQAFTTWKAVNRSVRKGERGLQIWAPNLRRPTEDEAAKLETAGKKVRRDPDGKPSKVLTGWRVEHVFDVSQTEGEPVDIPDPVIETIRVRQRGPSPELLTGDDVAGAWDAVTAVIAQQGYTVSRGYAHGANGYTDPTNHEVRVRDDVSPAQALKTEIHELAHIVCGHVENMAEYVRHRGRMETEAESVAYIVCGVLGLDSGQYSAPYVRTWSEGNPKVLAAAAETVVTAAQTILRALDTFGVTLS